MFVPYLYEIIARELFPQKSESFTAGVYISNIYLWEFRNNNLFIKLYLTGQQKCTLACILRAVSRYKSVGININHIYFS